VTQSGFARLIHDQGRQARLASSAAFLADRVEHTADMAGGYTREVDCTREFLVGQQGPPPRSNDERRACA
jgi:hypothetical protein